MRFSVLFILFLLSFVMFFVYANDENNDYSEFSNLNEMFKKGDPQDWDNLDDRGKKILLDLNEKFGFLSPKKDDFFTEFGQGFSYSALRIWGNEDKLRQNQHLRPYPNYELASLDPVDIARTIGTGLGYVCAIGVPALILASPFFIIRWKKKRRRKQDAESIRSIQNELKQIQEKKEEQQKNEQAILTAMDELETGNLDKLTWAKALIAADGDEKRAKIEYLKLRGQ